MPKRKRTTYNRRSNKRRAYGGRVRRRRRSLATFGIPRSRTVKLRYVENLSLNAAAGTPATYIFRANSINDPNYSGVGHQPSNHDMWASLYNHYVVKGSKLTIRACGTNGTNPSILAVQLNDDTTLTLTSNTQIMEQGKARWTLVGNSISNGDMHKNKVTCTYSARKDHGIKDVKDNITRIGAAVGANPSEEMYYHVWTHAVNASVDAAIIDCVVTIDYVVTYSELKDIAES